MTREWNLWIKNFKKFNCQRSDCDVENFSLESSDYDKKKFGKEPEEKSAKPSGFKSLVPEDDLPSSRLVGQLALHCLIGGNLPLPAVRSYVTESQRERSTEQEAEFTVEYYSAPDAPENSVLGHLRFALIHEPCDLRIICEALRLIGPDRLAKWVRDEPEGSESRRAWFFYETFTGETLPVENARQGNFVDALLEKYHYVALPRDSLRHRVRDNLLGAPSLCPTLRRTPKLEAMRALRLRDKIRELKNRYPPEMLIRAENDLLIEETRSTFALEGEVPSRNCEESFICALRRLSDFDANNKSAFVDLQNIIVKPEFANRDWRDTQVWVGETTRKYDEKIHFIGPRPADVPDLMDGWMALIERLLPQKEETVDAVLAAAVSAFAFVFIHPFDDGNGRIHRFVTQYVLKKRGFNPTQVFLPISSSILGNRHPYNGALKVFSKPVMEATLSSLAKDGSTIVLNDTRDFFRYFDATAQAEVLYGVVEDAVSRWQAKVDYLVAYDAAFAEVKKIVQLPDKKADLLVRFLLQNNGRLAGKKRSKFPMLSDSQIAEIQLAVAPSLLSKTGEHFEP